MEVTEPRQVEPLAGDIGCFADRAFLEVVHRHHPLGEWEAIDQPDAFVPLVRHEDLLSFAGHEDLVDYRSPAGPRGVDQLAAFLAGQPALVVSVDSLPVEAAEAVGRAAVQAGRSPKTAAGETTARLNVQAGFDDYLAALSKKERHELRRKRRRFEEEAGPALLTRETAPGPFFDEFVRLHRAAAGDKGTFMTDTMAAFFADVLRLPGWSVDALLDEHERVTATSFAYQDPDGYYLYNSGYDPHLRHISPGIVLLGLLIEQAADGPQGVFDFLKGDETYKYRLGAQARQLYTVTA